MTSHAVRALYQSRARQYQRFFVDFLQWENVLDAFFAGREVLRPGVKILDAGCGAGSVTKTLHRRAQQQGIDPVHFYAFDLTPAMLDLFRQWVETAGGQAVHLRQADVLELPAQLPPDWRGFDWVISSAMLEYIPTDRRGQAIANLKTLLAGDGRLLLLLTRRTWVTRWFAARWWGTRLFDRETIATELERAGLVDIRFHSLPKGWDTFMLAVSAAPQTDTG